MTFVASAGNVRVTLENIGEGYSGDYDPTDPNDKPLLRFYVERLIDPTDSDAQYDYEDVEDASYCTSIPEDIDPEKGNEYAQLILSHVLEPVEKGESVKKLCADLSWLGHKGGEGQLYNELYPSEHSASLVADLESLEQD